MATLQWIIQVFLFPMELLAAALLYTHSRKPRTTSKAAGVLCIALFILLSMWSNTLPLFWSFAAIYGIALVLEWMFSGQHPQRGIRYYIYLCHPASGLSAGKHHTTGIRV